MRIPNGLSLHGSDKGRAAGVKPGKMSQEGISKDEIRVTAEGSQDEFHESFGISGGERIPEHGLDEAYSKNASLLIRIRLQKNR
jgi:hypothetical protein